MVDTLETSKGLHGFRASRGPRHQDRRPPEHTQQSQKTSNEIIIEVGKKLGKSTTTPIIPLFLLLSPRLKLFAVVLVLDQVVTITMLLGHVGIVGAIG